MKTFGWSGQESQHSRTEMSWADESKGCSKGIKECNLMSSHSDQFHLAKPIPASICVKSVNRSEEINMTGEI